MNKLTNNSPPLMDVSEAVHRMLGSLNLTKTELVPIEQAVGRVSADDIRAPFDLPLFNNSAMDGFAVRADDIRYASAENPVKLRVIADVPAGTRHSMEIKLGQAARIMTGAVLPGGADAVVPVENTNSNFDQSDSTYPEYVIVCKSALKRDYMRLKGEHVKKESIIIRRGIALRPQEVALAAMLGIPRISVYKKPRVAVISAGDELLSPTESMSPGKIFDSNTIMLVSQVESAGGSPLNIGIIRDEYKQIHTKFDAIVEKGVDLIISSAGVSVGAFDFIRRVMEDHGELVFWRVNMRPGKPLTFGKYQNIPFIGLPGNPVSAFVGFEIFVRPAILKMNGHEDINPRKFRVELVEDIESDGRESYLRAVVEYRGGNLVASLTGDQGSGNLNSLVKANALLEIPAGIYQARSGDIFEARML